MADDLNVDLDVGSNQLEPQLRRTADQMQRMLDLATGVRSKFQGIVDDLRATEGLMKVSTGKHLEDLTNRQKQLNDQLRTELELQKQISAVIGSGTSRLSAGRLSDGRSVADARLAERALSDAITGVNTSPEQLTARLALAIGKAQERLLGATEQAIEQSFQIAATRMMSRNAQMSVPGVLDARVINARVSAEREVALASTGATLGERQAGADAAREARVRAIYERQEAERENRQRDAAAKAAERERTAEERRRAIYERQEAERENRQRDTAMRQAAREQTAEERRRAIYERQEADRENRLRDRVAAEAVREQTAEARRRAIYERQEADRENRLRDRAAAEARRVETSRLTPETAGRLVARDERFSRTYGVSRGDFEQRIRDENLSVSAQADLLRQMRAGVQGQAQAGRPAPRSMADRVSEATQFRNALFDQNGGADMLTFQAKLATNYAIFGAVTSAIYGSIAALKEFDENLVRFQAITGTSNAEMGKFRENLLGVAAQSKFTVNELTQVAVALGQTGLSASDVTKALKPVVDLAAASGSTLQQSVEAITGVLGAYVMEASRAGDVSDVLVAALNKTKLTMDQLQLGIQYAANIARDSGVSFSELTASIGAMSQAGVRSGSTIGTGVRQLITELSSPTDKLKTVLAELGISLADVDLRTQGFTGVLETLRAKGFGTSEALRALDLRAAAAFSALSGQASKVKELEQEFLLTSAASEGAAKANESFSASTQRLANVVFSIVDRGFSPLVRALGAVASTTAEALSGFEKLGPVLPLIAGGLASVAASAAAIKLGGILGGLVTGGVGGLISAPVIGGAAAIGATGGLIYFLTTLQTEADKARERLDALKGVENELTSRQSRIQTAVTDIDSRIKTLTDRTDRLNADPLLRQNAIIEAQKAFGDLGLVVDSSASNIQTLITALQNLRGELSKEMPGLLAQQLAALNEQITQLTKLQEEEAKRQASRTNGSGSIWSRLARSAAAGMGDDTSVFDTSVWPKYDQLGPAFAEAGRYVRGEAGLNPQDAYGSSADLRRRMGAESLALTGARLDLLAQAPSPERDAKLRALEARITSVTEVMKLFEDVVKRTADLQGKRLEVERIQRSETAAEIQSRPEFAALRAAQENIYRQQDQAVLGASAVPGLAGFQAMEQARHSTDAAVREQLAAIDRMKFADVVDRRLDPKAVQEAYASISDAFNGLLKGMSKDVRDRFEAAAPEARQQANAAIRSRESQLQLFARQAQTGRDPQKVAEYEALAKATQEEINAYRMQLFELSVGPGAKERIEASPELRAKRQELLEQGQADLDKLTIHYVEIHRKLQEQLLSFQESRENARKSLLEEQIKGLEKVRDDVRTTPEKMREAVAEINRLLEEVAKIGRGINQLTADRVAQSVPQGAIPPSVTYSAGSVQQRIVDELRASGASEERIRYALASGQIESGYAPDVISGARRSSAGATGLFQFMPRTWERMYGTRAVDTDISAQIKAFQQFTDRNAGTFQSNMGRAATAEELYLMHQQGAAGAMALLRAGSGSALTALTGAYGGNAASARAAITGNGGSADMAADEFIGLITRKFRSAQTRAGNPFASTGAAEVRRIQQDKDDKVAEELDNGKRRNEQRAQEAERAANLAALKRVDAQLSETYQTQSALVKRTQDPEKIVEASNAAYGTLAKLLQNAREQDANRPERQDEEGRRAAQAATSKRFADLYQQQGLSVAETAGKAALKSYEDDLNRLLAQKKELERPDNLAREGNTELLNQLNAQIEALQRRKELEGEYAANQAKLVALEETLKQMKEAGLDVDKNGLEIQARIAELKGRQAQLEPTRQFAAKQAATQRTFSEAVTGGVDTFLKQRGILDLKGNLVDPLVEMQGTIANSLNTIGGAFDNFFQNLFSGSMKAGDALKKFATDILGGLMSQLSKSLTNSIFRSLFGGGGGLFGGLFGGGDLIGGVGDIAQWVALGGAIRMAGGGGVPAASAATANRDSRLVAAMPGEYMLRKSAVDAIGIETLDQMNRLGAGMVNRAPKVDASKFASSARAETSVYVVDRDQVPVPGQNEVVHFIGDNIQKGGAIRQLIKRVAAGG